MKKFNGFVISAAVVMLLAGHTSAQDEFESEENLFEEEPSDSDEIAEETDESESDVEEDDDESYQDDSKISNRAGLLLGNGFSFDDNAPNPFGLAVGMQVGHTMAMGLYLGVKYLYFVGEESFAGVIVNQSFFSADLGYDVIPAPVVIRPTVDIGLEIKYEDFFIAPGCYVLLPIDDIFLGLDVRYMLIVATETRDSVSVMFNGGVNY